MKKVAENIMIRYPIFCIRPNYRRGMDPSPVPPEFGSPPPLNRNAGDAVELRFARQPAIKQEIVQEISPSIARGICKKMPANAGIL